MGHLIHGFDVWAQAQSQAQSLGQSLSPEQSQSYFNGTAPQGGYFPSQTQQPMQASSQLGADGGLNSLSGLTNQAMQTGNLGGLPTNAANTLSSVLFGKK